MHRKLLSFAIFLLVTGSVIYFVWQGQFQRAVFPVAAVFLLLFFREPHIWWMVAVAAMQSGLRAGVARLSVHLIAITVFCALCVGSLIMRKGPHAKNISLTAPMRWAGLLLVVMLLTANIRGFGIRALGSDMWGGMDYINLALPISFFIFSRRLLLTERQLWRTIYALCLLGLLPGVMHLFRMAIPALRFLGSILPVGGGGDDTAMAAVMGIGAVRWQALQVPGMWAGILALLLYERRFTMDPRIVGLAIIALILGGLSGHRTVPVLLGLTFSIYYIIRRRELPMGQHMAFIVGGGVIILFLMLFAPQLPVTFQRAIAFVPGVNVVQEAAASAEGTTQWRIELWKEMLPMVPRYLLIGRGMAFSLAEAFSIYISPSDPYGTAFFIITHNYHSGPLFLLIDLGLAGLITALLFMATASVRYGRALADMPENTKLQSAYVVIYAYFVASCLFFFVVIGGVAALARLLVTAAALEVMLNTARNPRTRPAPGGARRLPKPRYPSGSFASGTNPKPLFGGVRRMPRR